MITVINELSANGSTPITSTYLEAARYFIGEPVKNGLNRNNSARGRVSHPGSYIGGEVDRHPDCTDLALDADACKSEKIIKNPIYNSPIGGKCQQNHE